MKYLRLAERASRSRRPIVVVLLMAACSDTTQPQEDAMVPDSRVGPFGGAGQAGAGQGGASPNGQEEAEADGGAGAAGRDGAAGSDELGEAGRPSDGDFGGSANELGGADGSSGGDGAAGDSSVAGEGNVDPGGTEEEAGTEFGFSFRAPSADDLDLLCTFGQSEPAGHVYVRLTQTGTVQAGIATVPIYSASLAQISTEGAVSDLDNVVYDYGGGHHNDSLQFDYDGRTYQYYHSSFGFGFRACQFMDCLNVSGGGDAAPETQGCGSDRALPEVCVQIEPDGSHAPLEDNFQKCPGDST